MDELKTLYQIQTEIWHLFKKYGVKRLKEDEWDELYREGDQVLKNIGNLTRTWDNCSKICT